jgi:hypothetical protein
VLVRRERCHGIKRCAACCTEANGNDCDAVGFQRVCSGDRGLRVASTVCQDDGDTHEKCWVTLAKLDLRT